MTMMRKKSSGELLAVDAFKIKQQSVEKEKDEMEECQFVFLEPWVFMMFR